MVELRKRKAPAEPAPLPPAKKKSNPIKSAVAKAKTAIGGKNKKAANGQTPGASASAGKVAVGDTITLDGFGGEVETNNGEKTTLMKLVEESKAGVVIFTYPKASTPGCTTQACLFRDSYTPLTATGLAIYGLSTDSPKSNTAFKTKQFLPYPLLCDPSATLIAAIGMRKAPKGTTRGVFVVSKEGKVLAAEPGGPAATVEVVKKLVEAEGGGSEAVEEAPATEAAMEEAPATEPGMEEAKEPEASKEPEPEAPKLEEPVNNSDAHAPAQGSAEQKDDEAKADVAADVMDTAEKLQKEDSAKADVAADVADSAAVLDEGVGVKA